MDEMNEFLFFSIFLWEITSVDRKGALSVFVVLFAETHYTVYYCSRSLCVCACVFVCMGGETLLMKILMTPKPKVEPET